jgi:membrane fusion protein (multidrug efflux system)
VTTVNVEIQKMPRVLTLTGSVIADRQSEVAANVAGRIQVAAIERGQAVKKGQVLAVVDARGAAFSASAATAQSRAAETQERLAKADCDRADALYEKGAASKQEYDRLKTQCAAQAFSASAAQANADLAKKQLGDTTIRAPFDGIVGERYVNVGEYVQAQTKVASLFRITPVRVQVSVPEAATPLIRQGQTIAVHVAAYGDREFPATVKYVAPALRPQTRDLLIEAVADNKDGALRPGMFATVQLVVGEESLPTVPAEALQVEGTVRRLFVARNGQAWEMVVRTGARKDGRVAVLEALTANDRVIVQPPPGLRDGAAIQ